MKIKIIKKMNQYTSISSTVVKIPFQMNERLNLKPGYKAKHKSFKTELELCIYRFD